MDFSGAVGLAIRVLKTAYQGVLRGVGSQNPEVSVAVASGVDYSLLMSSLRRSITHFKNTLREIQGDYNRLVEAGRLNEGFVRAVVEKELDELRVNHLLGRKAKGLE